MSGADADAFVDDILLSGIQKGVPHPPPPPPPTNQPPPWVKPVVDPKASSLLPLPPPPPPPDVPYPYPNPIPTAV